MQITEGKLTTAPRGACAVSGCILLDIPEVGLSCSDKRSNRFFGKDASARLKGKLSEKVGRKAPVYVG